MTQNCAIAVGINNYEFMQPLSYAQRDAETVAEFLRQEANFNEVFLFTTDSPRVNGKSTFPFRTNLLRMMREIFDQPRMSSGDNFWFFFSGHGMRHEGRDYLMPLDGDPEDPENSAIPTHVITDYLRECGADNVVMILDACRNQRKKSGEGIGRETEAVARQTGVISIFSCSPHEYSYEIPALGQGAFTAALLDGLGGHGRCATVERLNRYLMQRVPTLIREHCGDTVVQTPYIIAEPITKAHVILLPRYATDADIATLKVDAFQAEADRDWDLAEQLWIRVNAAASGTDTQAIGAFQRIAVARMNVQSAGLAGTVDLQGEAKAPKSAPALEAESVVPVDTVTGLINTSATEAATPTAFVEPLGNGVGLEMVPIPAGSFWMGQTEVERQEILKLISEEDYQKYCARELPRHQVNVSAFYIGKFAVTQAQYEAVMGTNPATHSDAKFVAPNKPVINVSWHDAVKFCEKLSQQTKREYRLPSEAEWEYACRAGTETPFYFGETISTDLANYNGDYTYGSGVKGEYRRQTTPVGSFPANAFGLFDMHGNVIEWCLDHFHQNYQNAPTDGSAWIVDGKGDRRILRGGSWYDHPGHCRSAYRVYDDPRVSSSTFGFRVVCRLPRILP
ncbi:MAG: SUMF1/EgtB/PvdO family nonheme iron enzyme [Thainema sp.]